MQKESSGDDRRAPREISRLSGGVKGVTGVPRCELVRNGGSRFGGWRGLSRRRGGPGFPVVNLFETGVHGGKPPKMNGEQRVQFFKDSCGRRYCGSLIYRAERGPPSPTEKACEMSPSATFLLWGSPRNAARGAARHLRSDHHAPKAFIIYRQAIIIQNR